jgi:serine protease Do
MNTITIFCIRLFLCSCTLLVSAGQALAQEETPQSMSWGDTLRVCQEKVVKIYGAGGIAGLESYQSGILVSAEGHILTAWSTVLDADTVVAVTTQGQRFEVTLLGADPRLEIAILKAQTTDELPHFSLKNHPTAQIGSRVLAITNLFGIATGNEAPSIQKGSLLATSSLKDRRGKSGVVYQGSIYVIDAMTNNPGAAGGAVTDWNGNLLGMVGKELRDPQTNIWLNYAIPVSELQESIAAIIAGKSVAKTESKNTEAANPHDLLKLGVVLVPDVLPKTPAFVDRIVPNSVAAKNGLLPDDLIIMVENDRIDSQAKLRSLLKSIDNADPVALMIQRGSEIVSVKLRQE